MAACPQPKLRPPPKALQQLVADAALGLAWRVEIERDTTAYGLMFDGTIDVNNIGVVLTQPLSNCKPLVCESVKILYAGEELIDSEPSPNGSLCKASA